MSGFSIDLMIIGLLLAANGLLAMAEIAVVSARKARLRQLAAEGDERAQSALKLSREPRRLLSMVQGIITLVCILVGAVGGSTLTAQAEAWLEAFPRLAGWTHPIALGGVVVLITLVAVIIGELVPRRIALSSPERLARLAVRPLLAVVRVAAPVVNAISAVTDFALKPFGLRRSPETPVTDEEVSMLIEQGLQAGVFHKAEKAMVEGVLGLDRLPVTAIMTPRPKIVFLNIDDTEEVNWRKIVASGHSHFPVYQANRDQVLGMVAVKALWAHAAIGIPTSLKNLLTPPLVVPETMDSIQLLESFKKSGRHAALVADEFGGIQGLVTVIDVLEAIVGDLPAQGDRDQPEARQREDGSWLIDATLAAGELKATLGIATLPQEAEADYQTVGGMVMTQFGRIPAAGDHFAWNGWRFEVVDMDRHRVDKVLVTRLPASAADAKQAG